MVKILTFFTCFFVLFQSQAQNADQLFAASKEHYYNFQYTSAIEGFETTKTIYLQKGSTIKALKSYYFLAMSYFELGEAGSGLDNLWDGSDLSIEKYGEESPQSGDFYIAYGKYYHLKESYDTAKMFYFGAEELKKSEAGSLDFAELYANLATTFDYNGQYDSAVYYYELSVQLFEKIVGLKHPYTDWVIASIPYPASKSGQHQKELKAALKSLRIKGQLWGVGSEDYATAVNAVAVAYQHLKDYENERHFFLEAETLIKTLYGLNSLEHATALYNLGNSYSRLNDYQTALEYNHKAHKIRTNFLGARHEDALLILRNIGNIYYDAGDYPQALSSYKNYMAYQVKRHGKASPKLIEPYLDLAQAYEASADLANAEIHYQKVLELQQKHSAYQAGISRTLIAIARIQEAKSQFKLAMATLKNAFEANRTYNKSDPETEAFIRNNMGVLLGKLSEYDKALDQLNTALALRKGLYGENSAEVAQTLSNLGNTYLTLERYAEASEALSGKLKISKNYFGHEHPETVKAMINFSSLLAETGKYREAIFLLQEALRIELETRGPESPQLISLYTNLAIVQTELTLYNEALTTIEKAKRITEKLHGDGSEAQADLYNTLGYIQQSAGNIREAFGLYQQAIGIYKQIFPADHLSLATSYNNLGNAYMEYHEYAPAKDYLKEALRIYKSKLGAQSKDGSGTQMNLAIIEERLGNYSRAIEIYRGLTERSGGDELFSATLYQNLGNAQNSSGKKKEAIASYKQALELRATVLGNQNPLVADMHMNIGLAYTSLNDLEQALAYTRRAKSIYEKEKTNRPDVMIKLYLNLSDIFSRKGDFQQAITLAEQAIVANRDQEENSMNPLLFFIAQVQKVDNSFLLFTNTGNPQYLQNAIGFIKAADESLLEADRAIFSDEDQVQFAVWKNILTNVAIKNSLALYEVDDDPKLLEHALYYAERSKANVLVNALNETRVRKFAGIDESLLEEEHELKISIQKVSQELFKLESTNQHSEERRSALQNRYFVLKRAYEEVALQLEADPQYQRLKHGDQVISLQAIQDRQISGNEGIVEYAASDSTLHIFFITKNDITVFSKIMTDRPDHLVTALRNSIIYQSDAAFEVISEKLYHLAMQEVEKYIAEKALQISRLTIVPEGPFNYLPFEALKRSGRYLIEDYDIQYSYSLSLSDVVQKRESEYLPNSCLAFAPVFSDDLTNTLTPGAKDLFLASRSVASKDMRGFSLNGDNITALPGTEKEVNAIDRLMTSQGHTSDLFVYANAKEDVIKSGRMEKHKYIHFATHGFVNEANPAFSGIFMSQNPESAEDCILFASEIYNLKLNAEMVTLSACETGLGKYAFGEGIVGLTRAFIYAGARNLLVSQWKVSDESTTGLMVQFYENILAGKEKSVALREAKMTLLAHPQFSRPYYWAPFVLIGE